MPAALSPETHNHVLAATDSGAAIHSGTLDSGPTFDASYPASNALDNDPSLYSRINFDNNGFVATIKHYVTFSASNDKTCRVVGAMNCRIPAGVTSVQLVVTNTDGTVDLDASRAFDPSELIPLQGETDRYDLIDVLDADVDAARLEIRWALDGNAAGSVDVGYLWAGEALVLDKGVDIDWKLGGVDPAEVIRSKGGALIANTNIQRRRTLGANLTLLDRNTALGDPSNPTAPSIRGIRENTGLSGPAIVIFRSDTVHDLQCLSMYGAFTRLEPVGPKNDKNDDYRTAIALEQIR